MILFLYLITAVIIAAYLKIRTAHSYWSKRGVKQLEPHWLLGNFKDVFFRRKSPAQFGVYLYREMKKLDLKYMGMYNFYEPILVVRDLELMKLILIQDFNYFNDRGAFCNEKVEKHAGHIVNVKGERWKRFRKKLTPAFTSGKMKLMFETIAVRSSELIEMLTPYVESNEPVEMKDAFARFTSDILGTVAFGIDCNTMRVSDSEFRKYGDKLFERSVWTTMKRLFVPKLPPFVVTLFGLRLNNKEAIDFFWDVIQENVQYREKNRVVKKDFLQMMIQLKNQGDVGDDDGKYQKNCEDAFTLTEVIANSLVFYAGGFETSSSVSTFTLYELAVNQDVQDTLRSEINRVLEEHDGKMSYDAIQKMTYLENAVYEGMRRHKATNFLVRKAESDYRVRGTDLVIEKGVSVWIPMSGFYEEEEYFPDPEKYDPDRFSEENKAKRPAMAFLPFGEGPRQCIGLRFGMLQDKVGIAAIIRNFRVTLNTKTLTPLEHDLATFVPTPKGGVWLNFAKV
ncbi:cytochrome P450 6a2-like [Cylas formicarius]|uniref:cytochrome P450 6a2-like n=1 Tax=Cylas formicarius TaxID=197179 RepID=UPI002958626F|nr:cytochrome P450 6a2-like [Cylas formicarius]